MEKDGAFTRTLRPRKGQQSTQLQRLRFKEVVRQPSPKRRAVEEYELSQTNDLALRRIAADDKIPNIFKRFPLLLFMREIWVDLKMNTIEIVVWAIYLERYVWPANGINLKNALLFSAFTAKEYLNEDVLNIESCIIQNKLPTFRSLYNDWVAPHRQTMSITAKSLNRRLNDLQQHTEVPVELLEYNFLVDDILNTGLPYQDIDTDCPQEEPEPYIPMIAEMSSSQDLGKSTSSIIASFNMDESMLQLNWTQSDSLKMEIEDDDKNHKKLDRYDSLCTNLWSENK